MAWVTDPHQRNRGRYKPTNRDGVAVWRGSQTHTNKHPPNPLQRGSSSLTTHRFFQGLLPVADVGVDGGFIHGRVEHPVG